MEPSFTQNTKNETEQDDRSQTKNGTRMERMEKKEREKNNLAEGTHSRTEQNDKKKSERAQP